MAILEVKNIEKHFGSTKVLEDVSFSLEEGSAFDLQKEMRELLVEANRKVRFHESFLFWGRFVEALVFIAVAVVVAGIILL